MLEAAAKGFSIRTYTLRKDDTAVAELVLLIIEQRGTLIVDKQRSSLGRIKEKGRHERFQLENWNGDIVVYAEKPDARQFRFVITFDTSRLELVKPLKRRLTCTLLSNGEQAGTIRPKRWFSVRKAIIDLPDILPLEVQAFIFWLAIVQWTRDAAATMYRGG